MPTVIALVTLAIRRWGHQIGGLIGSMPWVAGPILLFFILEQGKPFGISAIQGVLTGILALISFCVSYAYFSQKLSWPPTLLISYGFYTATAFFFNWLGVSLLVSYALTISSVFVTLYFFPVPTSSPAKGRRLPYDIPIRMLVATLFTLVITGLANILGPTWSGILTPFPILTSILAIFSHSLQGSSATITILRGLVLGLLGFTTFLFLQAFLLPLFSVTLSFGLALIVNGLINVCALKVASFFRRPSPLINQ